MPSNTAMTEGTRLFVSPLARRIAKEQNIDLTQIKGTGPHGRIIKADVLSGSAEAAPAQEVAATPVARPVVAAGSSGAQKLYDMLGTEYEAVPNSQFRKTVASRLQESKQTVKQKRV